MYRAIFYTTTLAAASALFAIAAQAQEQTPTQARLSVAEIATMLEAKGYTVREIELEHGRYDVEMTDANGMRVEAYLNPVTGEVMPYQDDDGEGYRRNDRKDRDDN